MARPGVQRRLTPGATKQSPLRVQRLPRCARHDMRGGTPKRLCVRPAPAFRSNRQAVILEMDLDGLLDEMRRKLEIFVEKVRSRRR